jgi:hypothetical protein
VCLLCGCDIGFVDRGTVESWLNLTHIYKAQILFHLIYYHLDSNHQSSFLRTRSIARFFFPIDSRLNASIACSFSISFRSAGHFETCIIKPGEVSNLRARLRTVHVSPSVCLNVLISFISSEERFERAVCVRISGGRVDGVAGECLAMSTLPSSSRVRGVVDGMFCV